MATLEFLQNFFRPKLADIFSNEDRDPDKASDTIWFEQDEAPSHYARIVRNYFLKGGLQTRTYRES